MNYKEQLKDKRWKQLAAKIKDRDQVCQMCGGYKNLEVHHTCYIKGLMAWEYEEMFLITLCRECHERETREREEIRFWFESALTSGMFAYEIKDKINAKISMF